MAFLGNDMASDIVQDIKSKFSKDKEYWSSIYNDARDDLRFLSDDKYAQWDAQAYNDRVARGAPVVTVDQLSQFVHQVANDIRMNTPTINVIPSGGESDSKTAEIYKGIIRGIEYYSAADDAYDFASLSAIKCSIGFIRVDHKYYNEEGFDQELCIERVVNPLACYLDAGSIMPDGSDAEHGTIIDKIRVSEFKRLYPGKEPSCFMGENVTKDDDFIYYAEHFYIEKEQKKIAVDDTGNVVDAVEGTPYKRVRNVTKRKVRRVKVSGDDILEETDFPGIYIPLVPVYGDEAWEDGERHLLSLIRKSKDAQVLYNYWKSLETELLMKAPQAPFMAAEGQTEQFAADWLNPSKAMVLRYKQTDNMGVQAPPPQRLAPPPIPSGVMQASLSVVDDIKATMGIYNASLGMRSNEQSGIAIARRQQEGDVATYHFGDNLVKSITHVGRILVNAIPQVYDTARIVRMIGAEDEPKEIGVNGMMAEGQSDVYDLSRGSYDVRVTTGAPFTTQRQEAMQFYSDIVTRMPDLMPVMGDLLFKYSDFAGAQAMAERMKKVIDPKFLDEEDRQEMQAPDPEKEKLVAALQEAQQAYALLQSQLENKQAEVALKAQEIEVKRESLAIDTAQAQKEHEIKIAEIQLELLKIEKDAEAKKADMEAELLKARIDAKANLSPDVAMLDPDLNNGVSPVADIMAGLAESIRAGLEAVAVSQAQGNQAVLEALTKPKQVLRDENGKIAGVV